MAAGLCGAAMTSSFAAKNPTLLAVAAARRRGRAPPLAGRALPFSPLTTASRAAPRRRGLGMTVTCFVPQDTEARPATTTVVPAAASVLVPVPDTTTTALEEEARPAAVRRVAEMTARKRSERRTYLVAAVMSSLGVTSMAVAAVYYRFSWQMKEVPVTEMLGTLALSVGAAVGMEFWARWAHRALWHASLWHMHESHHRPREGPFELNDVFAIINAVPAIALLAYGFFHRGLVPGLCFGAGLGITMLGMAYIFVHDGLVHRRFPVGPIADVPYFRRVAAAHKIHHMDRFDGVPYGFFLGPRELEVVGGLDELEKELARISREAGQEAQRRRERMAGGQREKRPSPVGEGASPQSRLGGMSAAANPCLLRFRLSPGAAGEGRGGGPRRRDEGCRGEGERRGTGHHATMCHRARRGSPPSGEKQIEVVDRASRATQGSDTPNPAEKMVCNK